MAGIGFDLKKVLENDKALPKLSATVKSMFVSSGPWITAVIVLFLINIFLKPILYKHVFDSFISVVIYAFTFSMIISSPFINMITRHLSDELYLENKKSVLPLFISGTLLLGLVAFILSFSYIWFFTNLREYAFHITYLFTSLSIMWLAMVFVSALKDYNLITYSFIGGLLISLGLLFFVLNNNLGELYIAFTIGINITISMLFAKFKVEYNSNIPINFEWIKRVDLIPIFFSGLFIYLAMWIDKFMYWFYSDYKVELVKGFFFFPDYDFSVFIAYITLIPTTAYFTVFIETVFYKDQRNYFNAIETGKNLDFINKYADFLKISFFKSLFRITIFQLLIGLAFIIIGSFILDQYNINTLSIPLLRISIIAVSLQMILNVLIIFLYYFNFQKEVLFISIFYFLSNLIISYFMVNLDFQYVGYSYFISVLLTMVISLLISIYKIEKINFYTFISNQI